MKVQSKMKLEAYRRIPKRILNCGIKYVKNSKKETQSNPQIEKMNQENLNSTCWACLLEAFEPIKFNFIFLKKNFDLCH